jgi:chromosome segregation protein
VYLKSLTLKGFKSFASTTTLNFEPGITCVVGPNGSGKSNVVDALAWVMGEQGAKTLRGGKMEDVIFAGTSNRAPLGRAEVILTIDNTDGALPIDYTEVTISRIMFRSGGSEYAINGEPCRLLDIQELLSDSGIGREMHVIVGQGQLDTILRATPEERRGFVEEAAGVLKHRKRKEKALRKLDAMQGNLVRLTDLTTELRRQLTPLGKQAEVARRAQVIQIDVRDSKSRIYADDLLQLRTELAAEVADETALRERRSQVEEQLANLQSREAILDTEARADAPNIARAQETWFRLSSLRERFNGTASLATERLRALSEDETANFGRDPEEIEREAVAARAEAEKLQADVETGRSSLITSTKIRAEAEAALTEENQRIAEFARAAADRRDGLTRLTGQVEAMRQRIEARSAEIDRIRGQVAQAEERSNKASQDFVALENQIAGLDAGEVGLDAEYESAASKLDKATAALSNLEEALGKAERERGSLSARVEALELALARQSGSNALLAADKLSGVLGSVASLVSVEPGYESAIAAALGDTADAIAVSDVAAAVAALEMLKSDSAGRAGLVISEANYPGEDPVGRRLPAGSHLAIDLVKANEKLKFTMNTILRGVVVVPDLATAALIVAERPSALAVTVDGDVLGRTRAAGGSSDAPSLLQVQSALSEAQEKLVTVSHEIEKLGFEILQAKTVVAEAEKIADVALSGLHESDANMSAVAEQLGALASAVKNAKLEAERLTRSITDVEAAKSADETSLAELEKRQANAEAEPVSVEPDSNYRDLLAADVEKQRQAEVEARLAVRTNEERQRAAAMSAESLERAARQERDARRRFIERQERRVREAAIAAAVLKGAEIAVGWLEVSLSQASDERTAIELSRDARDIELSEVRAKLRELAGELEKLVDSVHRDEVARAEHRLRIEALENRVMEELGLEATVLIEEFGPDKLVPPSPPAPGDEVDPNAPAPEPYAYVRAEQEKRLKQAERGLALLGRVNPLALEEFSALEERHKFLNEQLDDLRKSKNDLMSIIKDVEARVQEVFEEAFNDTAREFEGIFSRLFPGGEGRLILTSPDDLLTTGIEVEARPPGKKLKRLSLLSGGERSLTAVAFLVALFKARPSPFYVMDEVEAALDDANLGRLIEVMKELQDNSQLIVITHQKRTMEIADALYGVTMRGDGVTTVISQRLGELRDELEPANAEG